MGVLAIAGGVTARARGVAVRRTIGARNFLRLGGAFSRPASWLQDVPGYGLPQAGERHVLDGRIRADAASRQAQVGMLEEAIRRLLSPDRREALQGTGANVALIGERLRVLATGS